MVSKLAVSDSGALSELSGKNSLQCFRWLAWHHSHDVHFALVHHSVIKLLSGPVQVRPAVWTGVLQSPASQSGQAAGLQEQVGLRHNRAHPANGPPGQDGEEPGVAREFWGSAKPRVSLERTASEVRTEEILFPTFNKC